MDHFKIKISATSRMTRTCLRGPHEVVKYGTSHRFELSLIDEIVVTVLFGKQAGSPIFISATQWFHRYLTQKFRENWMVVRDVVKDIVATSTEPSVGDKPIISALVLAVARELDVHGISLAEIVDALVKQGLLLEYHGQRDYANKIIFAIVGWLTSLYEIQPDNSEDVPAVHVPRQRSHNRRAKTKVDYPLQHLQLYPGMIDIHTDKPLLALLHEKDLVPRSSPLQETRTGVTGVPRYVSIDQSLLSFNNLTRVGNVRIRWTGVLSSHLEFDPVKRQLSIFQYPSHCLLLRHAQDSSFYKRGFMGDRDDFYNEIILSYNLLFGEQGSGIGYKGPLKAILPSGQFEDPLLAKICANDWGRDEYQHVYGKDADSSKQLGRFLYTEKLRLLGDRLESIQSFIRTQNPHSIKALWYDRQNQTQWWTFWCALVLLGLTIVLGLVQTTIAVHQVYGAYRGLQELSPDPLLENATIVPTKLIGSLFRAFPCLDLRSYLKKLLLAFSFSSLLRHRRIESAGVLAAVILDLICLTFIATLAYPEFRAKSDAHPGSWLHGPTIERRSDCHCGKVIEERFFSTDPDWQKVRIVLERGSIKSVTFSKRSVYEDKDLESQRDKTPTISLWGWGQVGLRWLSKAFARHDGDQENNEDRRDEPPDGKITDTKLTHLAEPLFLAVCVEKPNGSTAIVQINVAGIRSDTDLFACLREHHLAIRGRWIPKLKFRSLESIKFVQFELWPSDEVDIQPFYDDRCLPPANGGEYEFESAPTLPPISSARLMHFWKTPNHPDGDGQICLDRFPKRKLERLYVSVGERPAVGWGIQLSEGVDWFFIWILIFLITLMGSLVFGVTFAVLEHDIQSAFSISSYVISLVTLGIGAVSICGQRIVGRYYT